VNEFQTPEWVVEDIRRWRRDHSAELVRQRAVSSLYRAIDTLLFKSEQWERGDAALALADAVAILRSRIALLSA
jgi:hypothetical protein